MVRASGELQLLRIRLLDDSAFEGLTEPSFIIPWLFWERVCFLQSFMEKRAGLLAAELSTRSLFTRQLWLFWLPDTNSRVPRQHDCSMANATVPLSTVPSTHETAIDRLLFKIFEYLFATY
jgi:hypothetical protein